MCPTRKRSKARRSDGHRVRHRGVNAAWRRSGSPPKSVAGNLSRPAPPALAHPHLPSVRHHSSLAMPPRRRYYTVQHRLLLLEQVRICRDARLPQEPEEDFEKVDEGMPGEEEQEPAEEEEETPALGVGEEEVPTMEEDVDVWPEQHAILNSIRSESAAEARRRRWQQMEAALAAPAIADNDEI